jgi:hypothetical protein
MIGLRQRLRYRFDNYMARGVGAQILLLAVATVLLVVLTAVAVKVFGVHSSTDGEPDGFGRVLWKSLMHSFDAGTLGGDPFTSLPFLFIMLIVTIGGIFVVSALIGVLNNAFGAMMESLRRGRSTVIEEGHTVILGFTPKIHTILSELAAAGSNQRDPCVVVLADRDKVAMDEEIASSLSGKRLRVVTRRGSPMTMADLALVGLSTSKAVIVLAPETHADGSAMAAHESDTVVLKALLAISKVAGDAAPREVTVDAAGVPSRQGSPLHIVAELQHETTESVARMVVGDSAALIVAPPLISRLLVQTGRQSGLSMVYTELLDFGGVEMYIKPEPGLTGRTFRDGVFAFDTSSLMGVIASDGELLLPPPFDRTFATGDQLILISEDDDTMVLDGRPVALAAEQLVANPRQPTRHRERTLVLGASDRLGLVLHELDQYVAPDSETVVVGLGESTANMDELTAGLVNMTVNHRDGDVTARSLLDELDVLGFDHVLVLSETAGRTQEMADARTMITLLHLRDMARKAGKNVPITSEILDMQNRDLAAVAEADDFIVSNTLISLLVTQVAENHHLVRVFADLFSAGGHEIYLKPVADYVPIGVAVPYQAVVEAGLRRGEVAIGYRQAATGRDPAAAFGVVVNPTKSASLTFARGDKIIVVADD